MKKEEVKKDKKKEVKEKNTSNKKPVKKEEVSEKVEDKKAVNKSEVKSVKKNNVKKEVKPVKNKVIEKSEVKKEKNEVKKEKNVNAKYVFIYFFMALMIIAIVSLLFVILNDKFSLIYKNPIVTVELEELGEIKLELEPTKAPNTVANFVKLVESGFYDGQIVYGLDAVSVHFGRDKRGFAIEPVTSMIDKSIDEGSELDFKYEIDGEFEKNNFKSNDIKHEKYVISLTRADYASAIPELNMPIQHSYNSGTAMFKILFEDAPGMNGNYAAFGKVIEGQEIIDELAKRELRRSDVTDDINGFVDFVTIKSMTVETFGRKFKDVKLHKQFLLEDYLLQFYQKNI